MFPFLLFLALFNRFIYKSSLNPIFLQSVLWLVYYSLLSINIKAYDVHLYQVTKFILYQSIGFSLGGFLCYLFTKKSSLDTLSPLTNESINISQRNIEILFPIFFILQVVTLLVYIKSTGNTSILAIADVREKLVEEDGKKFGTFGLIQLMMSVYLILTSLSKTTFTKKHWLLLGLFLYYTILLGSRAQFIYYFLSLFYILLWQKRINGKKIFGSIALILGLLYIMTILRGANSNSATLTEILMIYTITAMPALKLGVFANSKCFGYYTFRVIYVWINKLGFNLPINSILSEYTMTPLPTNVYSYVKPYYLDFGYLGILFVPLFLGFLQQFFYFRARKGSFVFLFLTSILMYPLLMQVFEETYFLQLTNIIYSLLLATMVGKLSIRFKRKEQLLQRKELAFITTEI